MTLIPNAICLYPRTLVCSFVLAIAAVACSSDPPDNTDTDTNGDTGEVDVDGDAELDVADVDLDTGDDPDSGDDTDTAEDADTDTDDAGTDPPDADTGPDVDPDVRPPCATDGEVACSPDGMELLRCVGTAWETETACMADFGQLCEAGACVAPHEYGAPEWSACDDDPRATVESLADKAAYFDEIAERLHVHPDMGFIMNVTLATEEVTCPDGETAPCYAPIVDADNATADDVARWHTGENDGLWNGLYIASQAFRYSVTEDPDVLDLLRTLLDAEVDRMRITGVPGVFTRQYIAPDLDGVACPTEDSHYVVDEEKDDNRWVQIREDGCAWVIDRETMEWTGTDHCDLDAYAGYCWLDNVSQDEYAGHMFALAALWLFVDDTDIRTTAAGLAEEVGVHLMENELQFIDWDGRPTEHGRLYVTSFAGTPGFLATEALGFIRMAAVMSGNEELQDFYDGCLLQRDGRGRCMDHPLEHGQSYAGSYLEQMALYLGPEGCLSNFNNYSMVHSYMWVLLQFETDPELRARIQDVFDEQVMRFDSPRAMITQNNSWFNFMWAAGKALGPDSDGPAYDAVEDGICSLRQFPARLTQPTIDQTSVVPEYCEGRLGGAQSELPVPIADRCPSTFIWWASPYNIRDCTEDLSRVTMPADYLMAYWMGRYYGFISEDM